MYSNHLSSGRLNPSIDLEVLAWLNQLFPLRVQEIESRQVAYGNSIHFQILVNHQPTMNIICTSCLRFFTVILHFSLYCHGRNRFFPADILSHLLCITTTGDWGSKYCHGSTTDITSVHWNWIGCIHRIHFPHFIAVIILLSLLLFESEKLFIDVPSVVMWG